MKQIFAVVIFTISILNVCFAQKPDDSKTALATINNLFAEMANHNPPAIAAIFMTKSQLAVVVKNKEGKIAADTFTGEEFSKFFADKKDDIKENMYDPKVKLFGDLATVWGRYVFFVNGKILHCGVDTFNLVRIDEGWKIVNAASTIEPQGCTDREKKMKVSAAK